MALTNGLKDFPKKTKIVIAIAAAAFIAVSVAVVVLSRSGYTAANMRLLRTDGIVEISATNPKTSETNPARVEGGKQIKVYLYTDRKEDTVEFELSEVSEEGLPEFPLQRLAENEALPDRVCAFTSWNKEKLLNKTIGILAEENNIDITVTTPTAAPSKEHIPTPEPVDGTPAGPSAPTITPPVSITPATKPTGVPTGSTTATQTPASTPTPAPVLGD